MSCDVGELTGRLKNEHSSSLSGSSPTSQHYPTLPSLYLRHSSFSNPSVALPTSQFILQPFFPFSYVTSSSLKSPGEPTMRYVFNWRVIWGSCWPEQLLYTTKSCVVVAVCRCAMTCWRSTSPSCRRNCSSTGLRPVQYSGQCLLYPAEKPNVTASCNWWPPIPWSLKCGLCVLS